MPKKYFLELKVLSLEHLEQSTLLHMYSLYSMLSRILTTKLDVKLFKSICL